MTMELRTAEFVLPGHPDKLCDAIADGLVEAAGRLERRALCGVEVAVDRAGVFITGRIACHKAETIDIGGIVRRVFRSAGYGEEWQPAPEMLGICNTVCFGPLHDGEAEFRAVSDDQSMVTGYAVDCPGTNYLPVEHWVAYRLARRLRWLRCRKPELRLGPDGKVIVVVEVDGARARLASISASLHQAIDGPAIDLHRAVLGVLQTELEALARAVSGLSPAVPDDVFVNGAGNFAVGGPLGDNGLSGKKLVVDAYGPRVPIGGGALSGKDFFKADRAGAIIARRLAKAVVLTGAARACTATLAFFPGATEAQIISLVDEAGQSLDAGRWGRLIDRSLAGTGERYTSRTRLIDVARWGHFTKAARPWEPLTFDGVSR